ncbi:hypothetical protein D1BOALGB6SA_1097 [Olavius sp. associated proteobacterium Delta 1]|nr:hypothetical protein D1BOALGB6SA_1097 [Olavius sp. associated proteobacterium Delta 1]
MEFIEKMNQRVKKLSIFDLQLIKWSSVFFALFIAKIIPEIMNVNIVWFLMLCILCILKPFYVAWIKNE